MTVLIPKESVTRFLGRNAPKYVSYPAAALVGSVLAVCSCTIVPLRLTVRIKSLDRIGRMIYYIIQLFEYDIRK
jgi:uncharacterized membrane protein YraQ (UPF0718 family)